MDVLTPVHSAPPVPGTPARPRDPLVESGLALARPIDFDRLGPEIAQQVRRAVPSDAFALALLDEHAGEPRLHYQLGFDEESAVLAARLAPRWSDVLAGRDAVDETGAGMEITVPLRTVQGVVGAMTVRGDTPVVREARDVLATLAAQAALATERALAERRSGDRQRQGAVADTAAGLARELRNPLVGIASAAQLLRFRAREDPVVERNIGRILREVERLTALAGELLDFGRPHPLVLASADPDAVWDEVIEAERGALESRGLTITRTRAAPAVRRPVDAAQLATAFRQLLHNSIDASPVNAELVLRSTVLPNGTWRCALSNEGAPVPPDILPRAFELFVSTKSRGTGLGLAISRRIITAHHGTIAIDSAAEHGTTVTVALPPAP